MWKVLGFFIVVGALVWASVWMADRPGAVVIDWQGWRIDTSVPVLLLGLLLIAGGLTVLVRVWSYVRGAPSRIAHARAESKRTQGLVALSRGYQAIAAGDAKAARRLLREADGKLKDPSATLLLAAQTAELEGDEAGATERLKVLVENPETRLIALRRLAEQDAKAGHAAKALEKIRDARKLSPEARWAAKREFDLETGLGQWAEAEGTLSDLTRLGEVTKETARHTRAVLLTARAEEQGDAGEHDEAIKLAREAVDTDPTLAPATGLYARLLVEGGKERKASAVIEDAWARTPHPDLADAYLAIWPKEDALAQARRAEQLAARNPDHPESLLIVAETALAAELWGRARDKLKTLAQGPGATRRVARLMAQLEQTERKNIEAANEWLRRVPGALPNPAWRCASCGTETPHWAARCPNCASFDSIVWSAPARALAVIDEDAAKGDDAEKDKEATA